MSMPDFAPASRAARPSAGGHPSRGKTRTGPPATPQTNSFARTVSCILKTGVRRIRPPRSRIHNGFQQSGRDCRGRVAEHVCQRPPACWFSLERGSQVNEPQRFTVRHTSIYRYSEPVDFGEHRMLFRPRSSHDLRLVTMQLKITPEPARLRWLHDIFDNS